MFNDQNQIKFNLFLTSEIERNILSFTDPLKYCVLYFAFFDRVVVEQKAFMYYQIICWKCKIKYVKNFALNVKEKLWPKMLGQQTVLKDMI